MSSCAACAIALVHRLKRGDVAFPATARAGKNRRALRVKPMEADLGIAFVGTHPPRRCGIATFTRDLADAIGSVDERVFPMTLAVTEPGGRYEYPGDVKYEIRQGVKGDYARAAQFVNYSDVRLVSVQHEHGIFGGDDGAYILDFVTALRVPVIATLHTVLKDPSDSQKAIVQAMAKQCAGIVVMSKVAAKLLGSVWRARPQDPHYSSRNSQDGTP